MNTPNFLTTKHIFYFIILSAILLLEANCTSDIHNPLWCNEKLPDNLTEISGLAPWEKGSFLAIQDEEGKVFKLDKNGNISKLVSFHKKGDFEGIATTPNATIWVLRSDGTLFEISKQNGEYQTKKHPLDFLEDSDSEGLCYDVETNSLLIAVKDYAPGLKNSKKAVYRFSLATYKLAEEPFLTIDTKRFHNVYGRSSFAPSAITLSNDGQHYYVLSGRSQQIAVLNRSGQLVDGYNLDREEHRQPEGIKSFKTGYFIANEGRGKKARIRCWSP